MREHVDPVSGERIVSGEAACGLSVQVVPRPDFERACARITVDFGAIDRDLPASNGNGRLPAGVAHFLEHKMFEKERGDLFPEFSRLGVSANAMTGHSATSYVFTAPTSFDESLDVLLELVFDAYFTDELVAKEQGIIAEEIRGYEDSAGSRAYRAVLQGLFHEHPIRDDIAGTEESIGDITADTLHRVHEAFYAPRNAVLCVAGSVDPEAVLARVDARLGAREGGTSRDRPAFASEPEQVARRRETLVMPVGLPICYLGFKGPVGELSAEEAFRLEIAGSIALELILGETTELWERLYGDGVIGEDFSWAARSEPGTFYTLVGGQTPDPEALEARVLPAIAEGLAGTLDAAALERVKRRTLGDYVRLLDSMEGLCAQLAECHHAGLDFFSILPRIDEMTVEDVRADARRLLDPDRVSSVAVVPATS